MTTDPVALELRGGTILDHVSGTLIRGTLRVADGRIAGVDLEAPDSPPPAAAAPAGDAARIVDATGLIIAAGLVDLHTHVFTGQDLGVAPDTIGPPAGVTTMIDAGSAGGHLVDAFRAGVIERSAVRVRPFLNIASIGTTSIYLGGELRAPWYADEATAVAAVERHADLVVGIKVRASGDVGGEHVPEALLRARRVADRVNLPLMVHLGPPPESVDRILGQLRAGDILTHAFTGWAGNTLLDGDAVRPAVLAARERGVVFDIGHGHGGFDVTVATRLLAAGFPPDTLSTDVHTVSRPRVVDLPAVLSRFLALGMPLAETLLRATIVPARVVGLDRSGTGTLAPGAPADLTVLRLDDDPVTYEDGHGHHLEAPRRLVPLLTVIGGRIVHDRLDDVA